MLVMTLPPKGVMSQMIFSHDTELTLRAACVLINTDRVDGEQLGDMAALDEYLDGFGWTGRRDRDAAELDVRAPAARAARPDLGRRRRRGTRRRAGQRAAERHPASPWLTRHAEMPEWHLHLASIHDPLWQRMGAEMAMALADLIRAGELRRLKIVRGTGLRRGAGRPVAQPVADVLRHRQLRQPSARGGVPGSGGLPRMAAQGR